MVNPRVFLDFSVEGQAVGRVVFELFADVVPKTAENFRALCTGSAGVNAAGVPLWYKGSIIHRIIAGFMCQGGDFESRNGKGGTSIYPGGTFDDEDLTREIDAEGLLVMANRGRNTNGSQWFVSLRPCPHLAGKHCVFGKVVKGYDIIEGLSKLPVNEKDFPVQLVTVSNCGELELRKAPAKKARSPSPTPSRSRSNSVASSRSASPEDRKRSSKRHRSHRERDENGNRIHKKHRSKKEKKDKKSKDKKRDEEEKEPELTAAEIEVLEARKRVEELEEVRRKEDEQRRKVERERELEELKRRYESQGSTGGVKYKGRGVMKAREDGSSEDRGGMRGW